MNDFRDYSAILFFFMVNARLTTTWYQILWRKRITYIAFKACDIIRMTYYLMAKPVGKEIELDG